MAITRMTMKAAPEDVFAVLADGHSYEDWLIGCKCIRPVDDGWPAEGTRIHHRFGAGPVTTDDTTVALSSEPPRRLVMEARARPVGVARVEFEISPAAEGCVVTVTEKPVRGLAATLHNPVFDALVAARNKKSLEQLREISEAGRRSPATGASG